MKALILIAMAFTALHAQAQKQFIVDPDAEVRQLSGSFSSIKVSSGIHLYISKAADEVLAISATDEKTKSALRTEVQNGVLSIFYASDKMRWNNNSKLNVYVAFKTLEQLQGSGASNIYIAGSIDQPILNVQLTGASELKGAVKIDELNIKLTGASEAKLSGTAKNINIESSGASDVKGYDLVAETCNIKASGASDVNITVNGEISANASGASNVYYKGGAELKVKQSTGASSIARVQ